MFSSQLSIILCRANKAESFTDCIVILWIFALLGPLCYKLITIGNCYLETGLSCIVY